MNMKMNFSMDEIRLKVEEYIKKGGRAAGRPVLTAYYVMTADSTPESERTNIMIALVAIVFPTSIEDLLGQVFMVGKGFAAVYAYKKVKKYITPQIKDKVEAKLMSGSMRMWRRWWSHFIWNDNAPQITQICTDKNP